MKPVISKQSRLKISVIITAVSVALSVLVTFSILTLTGVSQEAYRIALVNSIAAPALISPCVTWYLIGLVIKIRELEKQQRFFATHDELTGVMNRRAFFESFNSLKEIKEEGLENLTLAYMDLDDFKLINDSYGHDVGDRVLQSFSDTLKKEVRSEDIVARIGGEEFAIILPNTPVEGARKLLERIRKNIASKELQVNHNSVKFSVSIGLADCKKGHKLVIDQIIQQADKALYKAKTSGKNCIAQYNLA